jgi:hypothetical protein
MLHVRADISRNARRSVRTEVLGLYSPYPGLLATASRRGEQRRMDILGVVPATCDRTIVDVTVPHHCACARQMR